MNKKSENLLSPQIAKFKGILPINKPRGKTSFSLVSVLRKLSGEKKIGHSGTLDPFATGVIVLLVGREFTKQSSFFTNQDKEYLATLKLGEATTTFDCDGPTTLFSSLIPTKNAIEKILDRFQGEQTQIPPMFSAKKIGGKKLYELARKGIEIERAPVTIQLKTEMLAYDYPFLTLKIQCSKGTYIRTIAHDIGMHLSCYAHLTALTRTRSGSFHIDDCLDGSTLFAHLH